MATAANSTNLTNPTTEDPSTLVRSEDANKESTTLLWFDPNIGSREDTEQTKENLRSINDFVVFHTDLGRCVTFIQSINKEKIFLITSGSKASQLLPLVAHLPQVDSIFIFCLNKDLYQPLVIDYPKIIGIYIHLDDLCSSIRHEIDLVDKQVQTVRVSDGHYRSIKDLSQQLGEFLWLQLFHHVIIRLPRQEQAKQQMIDVCRQYYHKTSKDLQLIDEFERDYRPEEAIRWYSKPSFVYKMVNKALRSEDLDQLQTFRFFIGDLSQSLARGHQKILTSSERELTVYRGTALDKEEFEKLRSNPGQLISTNGYLSTSRSRTVALSFTQKLTRKPNTIDVLFQIQCDVQQLGRSVVYADIATMSEFLTEEEVLFDLNASFRLESIEQDESVQVIRMTATNDGEKITKDYIASIQETSAQQSVAIAFGRLMCDLGQYDKSQKYFEELLHSPEGEDVAWIEFNIGRCLYFKGAWEEAREHYDQAYSRMMQTTPVREKDSIGVLNNIGNVLYDQGKYDVALGYYEIVLKMWDKFYPSGHVDIATSLKNIGSVLFNQGKYDEALDYYTRALNMRKKFHPSGHVDVAQSFNNIGGVLGKQGNYTEALDYFERGLKMLKKFYPSGHVEIARSLRNIGEVLCAQEKYEEALDYHERALKMLEKFYPSGHVDIAASLIYIGRVLDNQRKYDKALTYHQRALEMQEKFYPPVHADIAKSLINIGNVLGNQTKHVEALYYFERGLKMLEKLYPSGHVDIATSLDYSGLSYEHQKKKAKALEYYNQAMSMYAQFLPPEHPTRIKVARNIRRVAE